MTYNTEKRAEILEFFSKSGERAFSAEDICAAILKNGRGKSTVYRLISKLVDQGALIRISDAKTRHVTYQCVNTGSCAEHLHLKCKGCGRLIHLDEKTSQTLETQILKLEGFTVDDGALLYGMCQNCGFSGGEAKK